MVGDSLRRCRDEGVKIIYAVPTVELCRELVELAERDPPLHPRTGKRLSRVPVFEISSRNGAQKPCRWATRALLHFRIRGRSQSDKPLKD